MDTPVPMRLNAQNPPSTQTMPSRRTFLAVGGLGEGGTGLAGLARPSMQAAKSHGVLVCSNNPPGGSKVAALGPRTADSWIPQNILVKTDLPAEKCAAIHKLNINNTDSSAILNYAVTAAFHQHP